MTHYELSRDYEEAKAKNDFWHAVFSVHDRTPQEKIPLDDPEILFWFYLWYGNLVFLTKIFREHDFRLGSSALQHTEIRDYLRTTEIKDKELMVVVRVLMDLNAGKAICFKSWRSDYEKSCGLPSGFLNEAFGNNGRRDESTAHKPLDDPQGTD